MSSVYIHDLNPVIFRLPLEFDLGPLHVDHPAVRWYGLAYLLGFVCGFYLLKLFAQQGRFVLKSDRVGDFLTYAAIFGVFLGGRLGYFLFYWLPDHGFSAWMKDPLVVIRVWEGGMASHGGILGLVFFTAWYAWKHRVSWLGLGDGLCTVAPLGLFFGRMANFVNGELYGRPAPEGAWAMKFPTEVYELDDNSWYAAIDAAAAADPNFGAAVVQPGASAPQLLVERARDNPAVREAIAPFLEARYPSQLYEGLAEGLLLFAVLFALRWRFARLPHGYLTAAFFVLYAVGRIAVEGFREPDSDLMLGLTKGQFYSLFMILMGVFFAVAARRQWFASRVAV